jgi:protein-S-isoprenylcysteine O-methyltransferase Ste14
MDKNLYIRLTIRFLLFMPFAGLMLFLPAGTFDYWEAWVFAAVFLGCNLALTVYLVLKDPKLLERRLKVGPGAEKDMTQKVVMVFVSILFPGPAVVPAFDHRYGWSQVPTAVVILGNALTALSYYGFYRVFRENTYGAATIQVEEGQTVISTGPYAHVRHPMYSVGLIMLISMPLALGSWWGLLTIPPIIAVLAWRLLEKRNSYRRTCQDIESTRRECDIASCRIYGSGCGRVPSTPRACLTGYSRPRYVPALLW